MDQNGYKTDLHVLPKPGFQSIFILSIFTEKLNLREQKCYACDINTKTRGLESNLFA